MTIEKHEHLSFVLKREIVQLLARFDTSGQVVEAIKADHGIDLSPQRVQFYDPTSKNGAALSDELKTLFQETRKKSLRISTPSRSPTRRSDFAGLIGWQPPPRTGQPSPSACSVTLRRR